MEYKQRSALIDGLLRVGLLSGVISVGLFAPNAARAFDKPIRLALKGLDKRSYQREMQRTLVYMRRQGLVRGDYEHGFSITEKGTRRLIESEKDISKITIDTPKSWDNKWRLLLYDIPERSKNSRDRFSSKLKNLGFVQLQRSVWVFPYNCEKEILKISVILEIDKYVTYILCNHINNQQKLIQKFRAKNIM